MTISRDHPALDPHHFGPGKLTLAEILEIFTAGTDLPLRFTAYDGSAAGPADAPVGLDLRTPRGTTYLATAPGELGLARAYVSGDVEMIGVHPGDPYPLLRTLTDRFEFERPPAREAGAQEAGALVLRRAIDQRRQRRSRQP